MNLKFLKLTGENFVLYENFELDFRKLVGNIVFVSGTNLDVAGADSNYSGKSLIGDMITDLLFDKTIRRHSQDSFVGAFKKWTLTSLLFKSTDTNSLYIIKKFRKHPKYGDKVFFIEKRGKKKIDHTRKTKADTYAEIANVLGTTWEVFKNRNFYGQDDNQRFLKVTDSRKANIIIEIQQLEDLNAAKKIVAKKIAASKKIGGGLMLQVDVIKRHLSEVQDALVDEVKDKKESIKILKRNIIFWSKARYNYVNRLKGFQSIDKCWDAIHQQEKLIVDADKKIAIYNHQTARKAELEHKREKLEIALASETDEAERIDAKFLRLKNELSEVNKRLIATCSKCGAKLTKQRVKKTSDSLKNELRVLEADISEAKSNMDDYEDGMRAYTHKILSVKIPDVRARRIAKLKHENGVKQLRDKIDERKELEHNIAGLQQQEESAKKELESLSKENSVLEDQVVKYKKELKEKEDAVSEISHEIEKNEFSKLAFERTMRNLFNSFINNLNVFANRYLSILCDNDIDVQFNSKAERKSKKIVDEINVMVSVNGTKPRNFRTYSGGEKGRVELVTQLSLFSSADSDMELIFLDEPFIGIDEVGRIRIIQLLQSIADKGVLVMVVSNKMAPNGYGSIINVVRKNDRSEINF
jgi:DNA repair exonuclease SbcCD ATPase subunit